MDRDSKVKHIKSQAEQLIKHRTDIAREFRLVIGQLINIRHFTPALRDLSAQHEKSRSELDPKNYRRFIDYLQAIGEAIFPFHRNSFSQGTLVCHPDNPVTDSLKTKWFFINGIATSPPMALLNSQELARLFRRPIHLIHTPTHGAILDIFRSFTARTLHQDGPLSRPAYPVIKKALLENDKVILIGHSQGAIVNSYVVRKLLKDTVMRKHVHKLEVYCLAGAADNFTIDLDLSQDEGRSVPYVEHFANEGDFFAQIGIFAHREKTQGPLFRLNRKGHLLNEHYLSSLEKGEYCHNHSRFFKYINGQQPTDKDYLEIDLTVTNDAIQEA